jgi:1,4-alpha-glucan branching enzyme
MAKTENTKGLRKPAALRVPFMTKVEGAKEVVLTGDFTNWSRDKIRLHPMGEGEWNAMLELPPGEYRYRLLVDGEWRDHAEAAKRAPNPYGSQDCILLVS